MALTDSNRLRKFQYLVAVSLAAIASPAAMAQSQPGTDGEPAALTDDASDEIVVTGTLIRGIAPDSSQAISVGREDIEVTGATTTVKLLANIPQFTSFLQNPGVDATNNVAVSSNGISLRGIGNALLLMDGRRVAGAGIKSTQPDPDFLPPTVIERLEVVTDGGSSIYGADAVSGVVNFITRRKFDGVEASARYGFADSYHTYDVNLIAGTSWSSGSAYVAYNHAYMSRLYGRDRAFVQRLNWTTGQLLDLQCVPGNVSIVGGGTTTVYGLPGLTTGSVNRCDLSDDKSIDNDDRRDSVFASLTQEFGAARFELRGYYTKRRRVRDIGQLTADVAIRSTSPFYRSTGDANATANQSVAVNFGPVFGNSTLSTNELEVWGITPTLTVELGKDWQVQALINFSAGDTEVFEPALNTSAISTAVNGGKLNPYDIASNSSAVLAPIQNWEVYGTSQNRMFNARVVADGPLFELPGGAVRTAVGMEYIRERYHGRAGNSVPGAEVATLPYGGGSRSDIAAFAELHIPFVGENNASPGLQALSIDLSGRYDSYSDFGDTFNPRVGVSYRPATWINLRGNWGTSFAAPSLAISASLDSSLLVLPFAAIQDPLNPAPATPVQELILRGGDKNLKPETAETWSLGFDIEPPIVPGLKLSANYFNVSLTGRVDRPPVTQIFWRNYTDLYILSPTKEQAVALASEVPGGAELAALAYEPGKNPVYAILDTRGRNLGKSKVSGLDFQANYSTSTNFGSIFLRAGGSYILNTQTAARTSDPFSGDQSDLASRLSFVLSAGATVGNLLAQATFNYRGGFDVAASTANNFQSRVDAFKTVDLFFKYDLETSFSKKLSFTASIDNLLDRDPSVYMGIYSANFAGYAPQGSVQGRLVQFGLAVGF